MEVFANVKVPDQFLKSGFHKMGVVTFISECGKYCNIRYSVGSKSVTKPFKVADIPS